MFKVRFKVSAWGQIEVTDLIRSFHDGRRLRWKGQLYTKFQNVTKTVKKIASNLGNNGDNLVDTCAATASQSVEEETLDDTQYESDISSLLTVPNDQAWFIKQLLSVTFNRRRNIIKKRPDIAAKYKFNFFFVNNQFIHYEFGLWSEHKENIFLEWSEKFIQSIIQLYNSKRMVHKDIGE